MGKRELLLAAAFLLVGFAVYQFTAPPGDPSKPGFSLSRIMDEIRREVRGQRATAEARDTTTLPVPPAVRELRLAPGSATVTITGEDRQDVEVELHVRSTGYDTEEASRLVKATRLKTDQAGPLLIVGIEYPREGRQTATMTFKVPAQLGVRIDTKGGTLKVENVASLALGTARGDTTIANVPGDVSIEQRGNRLTIADVGSLRLRAMAVREGHVTGVAGDASLNVNGGEFRVQRLGGTLDVESRNAELRFEQLDALRAPVRVNGIGGEIEFAGLRTEARIDGRECEIRVVQAAAAPLAIYSVNEAIEVTLAAGGFDLDARAVEGRITLDEKLDQSAVAIDAPAAGADSGGAPNEARATGTVNGGGPPITLRATRGDIVLRLQ